MPVDFRVMSCVTALALLLTLAAVSAATTVVPDAREVACCVYCGGGSCGVGVWAARYFSARAYTLTFIHTYRSSKGLQPQVEAGEEQWTVLPAETCSKRVPSRMIWTDLLTVEVPVLLGLGLVL